MSNFANLTANLNLNIQNFASNMQRAGVIASSFASTMNGKLNAGFIDPVKKAGIEYKDVARIVQGIVISKAFYSTLNAVRSATDSVWEFTKSLEYAHLAYTNLFHSSQLAAEFINVLKDFAARTPFTFQESEAAAKRLLAYGVQYQNVMYMMKGVLSASAMQGNPQVIESISRALGQIYTKGRLMNEEMRQLAESGIPAYEILREKLGLTQKQLQNLGRESIPASKAINALVDGMTERFGGLLDASAMTVQGLISNIKDNSTMLASDMTMPITRRIKTVLASVGELFFKLREVQDLGGTGAVFEYLVPESAQESVRTLIANLMSLWSNIKLSFSVLKEFSASIGQGLVVVLNTLLPVINLVVEVLLRFQQAMYSNSYAAKILTGILLGTATAMALFRIQALATLAIGRLVGVIQGVAKALVFLSAAILSNPITTTLILLTGLFVGVAISSTSAGNAIGGFFKRLTSFNGVDPDKLLLPSQKDRANDLEKFNKKLDGTAEGMDDLAKKADKTKKSLLSFDEAFKLTGPDESGAKGIEDMKIPDFGGLGDSLIPDLPDFTEFGTSYVKKLFESIKDRVLGMGLGGLIGGLIGGALGGPLGAKVGVLAGAAIGYFFEDFKKAIEMQPAQSLSLPIGALIGAAIGGLIGGPAGAAIGAIVGLAATTLASTFFNMLGRALGLEAKDFNNAGIGSIIGMGLGAVIGGILGGPAGAAIGAGVGLLAGGIVGLFWDTAAEFFGTENGKSALAGAKLGTTLGGLLGGPVGAALGGVIGGIIGANKETILAFCSDTSDAVGTWAKETAKGFSDWWSETYEGFKKWDTDSDKTFTGWITKSSADFAKWVEDSGTKFTEWFTESNAGFLQWSSDTKTKLDAWFTNTKSVFSSWDTLNTATLTTWWSNTKTGFESWKNETVSKFNTWSTTTRTGFSTWASTANTSFNTWRTTSQTGFNTWVSTTQTYFNTWKVNTQNIFTNWCNSTKTGFKTWAKDVYDDVVGWFDKLTEKVKTAFEKISIFKTDASSSAPTPSSTKMTTQKSSILKGHATGGVFNREHVANFAEGNKAEAIIPLENNTAMRPFVDAVTDGLLSTIAPMLAGRSEGNNDLRPLYVGTLIADDRGLKELNRQLAIIQVQEDRRRGK